MCIIYILFTLWRVSSCPKSKNNFKNLINADVQCLKLALLALLKLLYYCVWLGFAYTLFSIIDNLQGQGVIMVSLFSKIKAKAKVNIWDLNLARQVCILYIFTFTPPTDATHIIHFVWYCSLSMVSLKIYLHQSFTYQNIEIKTHLRNK